MSDWPLSLLLDEIWLRSRRLAVHGLERSGFWPGGDEHWASVGECIALGQGVDRRCLQQNLSAAEYAYLHSPEAFGSSRYGSRRRWPLVLAFGHQVTRLFSACHGAARRDSDDDVADVGACFNLGISLIDLVLDERAFRPAAETVIGMLADYDVKNLLLPAHWHAFDDQLVRVPLGDARIVLRIVSTVYKGMAQLGLSTDEREELGALLEDAFRAEIASARLGMRSQEQHAKSILPFQVMACIARANVRQPESTAALYREMAVHLGTSIALLDDLSDLVDDLRSSAVNSIVARPHTPQSDGTDDAESGGAQTIDDSIVSAIALSLLEESGIERAVENLLGHLRETELLALSLAGPDGAGTVARQLASTRTFIRNWLE